MKLELHATPEEVMRAVEAFQEFAQRNELEEKETFGLALALEECASNIVNHAYRRDPKHKFSVFIEHTGNAVEVELRDYGPQFDPTQQNDAQPGLKDDDRPPGGLGIQLVRNYMDDIVYRRQGRENVLRLTKRLNPDKCRETSAQKTKLEKSKHEKTSTAMPLEIQMLKDVGPESTGSVTVKLTGSLDTATAPELERQLAPVLATSVKDVVFDLANLRFISSAGLRVFSTTRKQLKERGGQASFVNMQSQIQEVFAIMKSLPGVAVFENVEELDRYLAARQRSHTKS